MVDAVVLEALRRRLRTLVPEDVSCGVRAVADDPVDPGEFSLSVGVADSTRRATAAGRALAREVLASMGVRAGPILRRSGGQPAWPAGITGSIAHDDAVCVCVCGIGAAIGVDVEPAVPLPEEIVDDVVCSAADRLAVGGDAVVARALFCAKEAVYKACFPIDGHFLEFADVSVADDPSCVGDVNGEAAWVWMMTTATKRRLRVTVAREPRLLAFARLLG